MPDEWEEVEEILDAIASMIRNRNRDPEQREVVLPFLVKMIKSDLERMDELLPEGSNGQTRRQTS